MEKDTKKFIQEKSQEKREEKASEPKVSFDSWFTFKVNQKSKVVASHYGSIKAYFKHKGLSEQETASTFDDMLKVFGF